MASFVPVINNPFTGAEPGGTFIPGTADAVGLLAALNAVSWADAHNHFAKDFGDAVNVILSPKADPGREGGATNWQISIRRNTAGDVIVGYEPMGTITGVGAIDNQPAGVSPAYEEASIAAAELAAWGANSDFHLWQVDNCLALLVTENADPPRFFEPSFAVGKFFVPYDPNLAPNVVSGRGGRHGGTILVGEPREPHTGNFGVNTWWGSSTNSRVLASIEYDGNGDAISAEWQRPSSALPGDNTGAGFVIPQPFRMDCGNTLGSTTGQALGYMPYFRQVEFSAAPLSVLPAAGADRQGWLFLNYVTSFDTHAIAWDDNIPSR